MADFKVPKRGPSPQELEESFREATSSPTPRPGIRGDMEETQAFQRGALRMPGEPLPKKEGLTGEAQDKNLAAYANAKALFDQRQKAQDALYAQRKAEQERQALEQQNAAMPALERMAGKPVLPPKPQPSPSNLSDEHQDIIGRYNQTRKKQMLGGKVPFTDEDQQNIDDYKAMMESFNQNNQ